MYRIVKKKDLNPAVTLMSIEAPLVAAKAQPGQFIILRVEETGERIPLTIADYDRKLGTVTIIFQIVGPRQNSFPGRKKERRWQILSDRSGRPLISTD